MEMVALDFQYYFNLFLIRFVRVHHFNDFISVKLIGKASHFIGLCFTMKLYITFLIRICVWPVTVENQGGQEVVEVLAVASAHVIYFSLLIDRLLGLTIIFYFS
ncbi:hypothetical protein ACJX0J_031967 [Zea mays]